MAGGRHSRLLNVQSDLDYVPRLRASATCAYARGRGLMRGRNLNLPVAGQRPDAAFGNIVDVVSDASSAQHALSLSGNASLSAPSPGGATSGPRFERYRMVISANIQNLTNPSQLCELQRADYLTVLPRTHGGQQHTQGRPRPHVSILSAPAFVERFFVLRSVLSSSSFVLRSA